MIKNIWHRIFERSRSKQPAIDSELLNTFYDIPGPPIPPITAKRTHVSSYVVKEDTDINGRQLIGCPNCNRANYMKHGDRILCGCGTVLETYGNGYKYWANDESPVTKNPYIKRRTTIVSTYDKLVVSDEIRKLADQNENIQQAIEELATLIDLHQNL